MSVSRRKLGGAVRDARRFLAEVKWLGRSEGCALLAEVIERDDRPYYLDALSVEAFTASEVGLQLDELAGKHLHELTEDDCHHLATLLRSRCKAVDYRRFGQPA